MVGAVPGQPVVMRQPGHRPGFALLQQLRGAQVQQPPGARQHQLVDDLPGQRVPEPEPAVALVQQSGVPGLGERRGDGAVVGAEHRRDRVRVGGGPDRGGRAQDLPHVVAEVAEPRPEHVTQQRRHGHVVEHLGVAPDPLDVAVGDQRAHHLLDQERDAGGPLVQVGDEPGGRRARVVPGEQRGGEGADLVPGERGDGPPPYRGRKRTSGGRLPHGHQHRQAGNRVRRQVVDQFQGRLVGHLQVLQRDHERPTFAQLSGHRAKQPGPIGVRIQRRAGHQRRLDPQPVQQRPERLRLAQVVTVRHHHRHGRVGEHLRDQARLAHPGFAGQDDQGVRPCQLSAQRRHQRGPAHEGPGGAGQGEGRGKLGHRRRR